MRVRTCVALAAFGLMAASAPVAMAHHSVAGQFDVHKVITLKGVIADVDWINPHIYVYLDVKGEQNQKETWRLEGVPVAMARKAGLSKTLLMGNAETVTLDINPARDGTQHLGFIIKINFPDGRVYQFAADSRETAAP